MPPVSLLSPVHFLFAAGVLVKFHVAKATLQYFLMCILYVYSVHICIVKQNQGFEAAAEKRNFLLLRFHWDI